MIPNMMAEWEGHSDPQSPTFVLDIKFPFPDNTIASSASIEGQRSPGEFSFRLSIQMPGSAGSAPVVQVPTPEVQSVNAQVQNAQQLEVTLKEQLQRQRNSRNVNSNAYQRSRRIEPSELPTPPSTSPSDRLSIYGAMEVLTVVEARDGMICDVDEQNDPRYGRRDAPAIPVKAPENTIKDVAMAVRNPGSQTQSMSYTKRTRQSRSPSPSQSRSHSPLRRSPHQHASYVAPRERVSRISSESPSPVRSLRRGHSPTPRRSRSVDSTETRGRNTEYKRLQRSRSPVLSSRRSSRSLRSRSRSRSNDRDSYMHSRQRSVSTGINDELAVERASLSRYSRSASPPPPVTQQVTPTYSSNGSERLQDKTTRNFPSLQLRISQEGAIPSRIPKQAHRRTCPFYHPTEKDKHPLNTPHPGYSAADFDEAVSIYEKRGTLPPRLIKAGVAVNPKNRQMHPMRSPTKSTFTHAHQYHNSQSSSGDGYGDRRGGRPARSRSPVDTPTKRRRIIGQGQYPQPSFRSEDRISSGYIPQYKPKNIHNTPFRREGPPQQTYIGRVPANYLQNNSLGSNVAASSRQRLAYGQPPNPGYYRSQ